jgi:hypothetical protein
MLHTLNFIDLFAGASELFEGFILATKHYSFGAFTDKSIRFRKKV